MNVCVLGAGTMGHGITQVCAMAGHEVTMRDIEEEYVENGLDGIRRNLQGGVDRGKVTEAEMAETLDRIDTAVDLSDAVPGVDIVIEAVPERMDLKKQTFEDVEELAADDTVIASNTSSLSVTEIASALDHDERAVGLHFFNPVHIMQLVEIVVPEQASEETVEFAESFVDGIDREPVTVRDSAGFASSRLGVSLGVEAIRMLEEGVASPQDIDTAMELGYNHPMGPIELGDVVGLDVRLDILEYLREELGERFRPPQLLKQKVRAGKLGKKSGEGFYVWEDGEIVGTSGDWGDD
ncbi:3-hydroxyacyl-CoA dehydrogenase family protein [Haloarchaeobius sp. HME9146]|uniref:3-hydroxyacyl-CoA dehydrogenase family protein n=1 Tax=Haloarchaeobius sp. HME9146 TaxID=2978732 RepID=UPI0021C1B6F3|nr:3-hydroxyacyl-CoA dehydrogenase family protein [Haloarchaeobius sp. HME9146]MCT9096844.1 3-hydroxyacyl-CoA dehydrogenase family protein [Haloarchaeobius sp. HME9146]